MALDARKTFGISILEYARFRWFRAAVALSLFAAVLYLFGGKVLEDMAFVLTIGVVTGTFSTVYIAGSLIVDWQGWRERWMARRKKAVAKA